jgi:O-antigen/teichoic acid export membrane protein
VNLNGQLPLYFFSLYFDTSYVGFFALANSVITIPLSVLTNSTTTVFLQKAAETLRANPESLKALVTELYNKLFLICFLPLTLFAFISTWAFDLVFGASWQQAGWIASLLAVNAMLTVPQQPLSVLFRLLNREHNNFMLTLVSIALRVAGLSLGIIYQDIRLAICGFVLGSIFSSALSITSIFRMVHQRAANLFWHVLAVVAVLLILNLEYLVS